jgi:hypothetical protein
MKIVRRSVRPLSGSATFCTTMVHKRDCPRSLWQRRSVPRALADGGESVSLHEFCASFTRSRSCEIYPKRFASFSRSVLAISSRNQFSQSVLTRSVRSFREQLSRDLKSRVF